jgi:NAD(P)-dependent dehydrogenase (short-subunit alcohol dehydrogenase family)
MSVALITGASAGLGFAVARALAERGWKLVIDARGEEALGRARDELAAHTEVVAIPGDVADPAHRHELAAAAEPLDLLVNNASELGPSPQPRLADYPLSAWDAVYRVNVLAPLGLIQLALPALTAARGTVVNISSDAAIEAYEGWGGYGSAKAALDQLTAGLGAEHPELAVYSFDPGDMRTAMHQRAFPGEDISDLPEPETVVPSMLSLIDARPASGRYRAADLAAGVPA